MAYSPICPATIAADPSTLRPIGESLSINIGSNVRYAPSAPNSPIDGHTGAPSDISAQPVINAARTTYAATLLHETNSSHSDELPIQRDIVIPAP